MRSLIPALLIVIFTRGNSEGQLVGAFMKKCILFFIYVILPDIVAKVVIMFIVLIFR